MERSEAGRGLLREDIGGQPKSGVLGAFSCALKLQMLMDENVHLEQHLAAMVLNNRMLQSMRSRKASFKL